MHTSVPRPLLAALQLGCCAGCLPNATWLPDSSGFVYTGGENKDKLYLYDLAKKAPRVLVAKGAGPAWPAVSPDGQRIAVALRSDDGTNVTLEVIVFDRDGKELHRSDTMNWTKHETGASHEAAQAFWVPGRDKLLLGSDDVTGFYDLKTKSSATFGATVATFGSTPIRPDGKGFLAFKKDARVVFMDWDGKEQEIEPTPKGAFENQGGDDPVPSMLHFPRMHASRWDGSTAVVSWDDTCVKIDADKMTGARELFKPAITADKKVIQEQAQLAGGGVIRAVELTKRYQSGERPQGEPLLGSYRVEVVKPGAKEPKVLMDGAGFFLIDPSPDGKKAVVKCSKTLEAIFIEPKPEQNMLFVIDGDGDVADTIDLAK